MKRWQAKSSKRIIGWRRGVGGNHTNGLRLNAFRYHGSNAARGPLKEMRPANAEEGIVVDKALPTELVGLLGSFQDSHDWGPSPAEGLRIVRAFANIRDVAVRVAIVELVERIAAGAP